MEGRQVNADLLHGFYLGDFLVVPLKGQVTGRTGSRHLPPKAVEVLLCLAREPGELVTREALIETVWGSGHGSSETLSHAVTEIRKALDDHAADPVFIQTLPRRGYRLAVEPKLADEHSSSIVIGAKDGAHQGDIGLFENLKRRGVLETALAYMIVGWLLIQIADIVFAQLHFPDWAATFVTALVIAGFPVAIVLSWFLEFRDGRAVLHKLSAADARKRRFSRTYVSVISALGIAAIGVYAYDRSVGLPRAEQAGILVPASGAELVPIAENSLAVLKLATIDDDERMRVFSYGLSEDLIDALARLPGLSVSSRGDSWSLPENANSEMVRRRLRVAYFVEGSIRKLSEDSLRIVVQLVDSATGFHVVSRGFDFQLEGFAQLQKEITSLVVANLRLALDFDAMDMTILPAEDTTIDAYLLYRRGLEELYKPRSDIATSAGIAYFSAALEVDSEYPAAYAGLCGAYTAQFRISRDPADIAAAETACARAYAVGPQLPLVLNAVGNLRLATGKNDQAKAMFEGALNFDERNVAAINGLAALAERDQAFDDAERLIRRTIELQPGNWRTMSKLAALYFGTGRYAEAVKVYRSILFIEPDNAQIVGNLGAASLMAGEFETARDALESALGIGFDPLVASNLGIVHYYLGDFARSVEIHRRVVEASPKSSGSLVNLGDALHFFGDTEGANAAFNKAIELARSDLGVNRDNPETLSYLGWSLTMTGAIDEGLQYANRALEIDAGDPYSYYYVGLILLQNGQADAAIDALESALENGYEVTMLAAEPYVQTLKSNPRFTDLLADYGPKGEEK